MRAKTLCHLQSSTVIQLQLWNKERNNSSVSLICMVSLTEAVIYCIYINDSVLIRFNTLNLWRKPHATTQTSGNPYKGLRGTWCLKHNLFWLIRVLLWVKEWWITEVGSSVLYKHQSTTKKRSKDPPSEKKFSKVGLIKQISGRKPCSWLLNMNQTIINQGGFTSTMLGQDDDIICTAHHRLSHLTAAKTVSQP